VEKGVRQVLQAGAIAGYPMEDLRVVVHDGKTHPVDSKEIAFVTAGRKAFLAAIANAHAIVLEPIVSLNITAPASAIGSVAGDLKSLRARINGETVLPDNHAVITVQVPLAELKDYGHRLKALTSGEGVYTLEFSHYEPAPTKLQQDLITAYRRRHTEENEQ
jgi:elongation factor G